MHSKPNARVFGLVREIGAAHNGGVRGSEVVLDVFVGLRILLALALACGQTVSDGFVKRILFLLGPWPSRNCAVEIRRVFHSQTVDPVDLSDKRLVLARLCKCVGRLTSDEVMDMSELCDQVVDKHGHVSKGF